MRTTSARGPKPDPWFGTPDFHQDILNVITNDISADLTANNIPHTTRPNKHCDFATFNSYIEIPKHHHLRPLGSWDKGPFLGHKIAININNQKIHYYLSIVAFNSTIELRKLSLLTNCNHNIKLANYKLHHLEETPVIYQINHPDLIDDIKQRIRKDITDLAAAT